MKYKIFLAEYLVEVIKKSKQKDRSFSLRKLSEELKINSGALSQIINGKRNISKDKALEIYLKIEKDPVKILEFKNVCFENFTQTKGSKFEFSNELDNNQFALISEWQHFAILSLMKTKNFKSEPAWISSRLGISVVSVKKAIERLIFVKLIKKDNDGNLVREYSKIKTSDNVLNEALKESHLADLELAKKALLSIDVNKRDFSSMIMAINTEKLEKAKELIRKFQDDISELLEENKNANEVYQLFVQLFPLSKF